MIYAPNGRLLKFVNRLNGWCGRFYELMCYDAVRGFYSKIPICIALLMLIDPDTLAVYGYVYWFYSIFSNSYKFSEYYVKFVFFVSVFTDGHQIYFRRYCLIQYGNSKYVKLKRLNSLFVKYATTVEIIHISWEIFRLYEYGNGFNMYFLYKSFIFQL